jgi:hypothetical protein
VTDYLFQTGCRASRLGRFGVLATMVYAVGLGCTAFNPAFLDLLDTEGTGQFATLGNAPGHVIVAFVNSAEVDEGLIAYLESAEGGNLVLTDAEKRALRPRVRFRVQVTFANGTTMPIEFIDGSTRLIDQDFDAQIFPDLNENDLDNVVLICDVAAVQILPGSSIEVFIPVELLEYQQVQAATGEGIQTDIEYQLVQRISPQFRALQVDELDPDGNVTTRRNIGVRDVPPPVTQPACGSVIAFVLNGTLAVPFLDGVDDNPSYDQGDLSTVGTIGGRYEFTVSVN